MTTASYPAGTRYSILDERIEDSLRTTHPAWCVASTDALFVSMLECGRRRSHDGPHYDFKHDVAWVDTLEGGEVVELET